MPRFKLIRYFTLHKLPKQFFSVLEHTGKHSNTQGKLVPLIGVIPCINSLRSISGVFKLIHLSGSSSSNYTSVKCHLSQLSPTRVMSSSQPLPQPEWILHCLEPAGSGHGMEDWAGAAQCDWKPKQTGSVWDWDMWILSRTRFLHLLIFLGAGIAANVCVFRSLALGFICVGEIFAQGNWLYMHELDLTCLKAVDGNMRKNSRILNVISYLDFRCAVVKKQLLLVFNHYYGLQIIVCSLFSQVVEKKNIQVRRSCLNSHFKTAGQTSSLEKYHKSHALLHSHASRCFPKPTCKFSMTKWKRDF